MAPPIKPAVDPSQSQGGGADLGRENPPSNTLWIGNVSPAVSEAELKALLQKHGKVDSFTPYPSRNYAFVYFREIEDAKSAKQALQGHPLRGNALKIEFAKPAKPCKSLWVAGISQSVSREELEKEFLKFGNIQDLRFLRDRNTAYIEYVRLEDANQALKVMNKKEIGGAQIRVDYLRSQGSRRENGPDAKDAQFFGRNMGLPDMYWMGEEFLNNYPDPMRKPHFMPVGSDAMASRVLLISYPPSIIIDEDMLHNAMILFGEIERINPISDRNCALVEFRSVEEARCAKEGLQGKLFNDPRIRIEYYNVGFPGVRGPPGDPMQPFQMDMLGLHPAVLMGNNAGHPSSVGMHGPDVYARSSLGPGMHGVDSVDHPSIHKLQNPSPQNLMRGPAWRGSSPNSRMVSSPSDGVNASKRSASGGWDVYDTTQLKRDSKRQRFDGNFPPENQSGLDEHFRQRSINGDGASSSLTRAATVGSRPRQSEKDCIWRGLIAKGGTPVCRARCVPIGDGLDAEIPPVVNISARTGLDLLSQRYEDAIGFSVVFFLPDSEDDFASYTEFLRYLASRDRAGVVKFDDGITMFVVPPSDFLTNVLKVAGPERLYGVVLKFPQAPPSHTNVNNPAVLPPYPDHPKTNALPIGYNVTPQDEWVAPLDKSRALPDDSKLPPKNLPPVTSSVPANSVPPPIVPTQAGLSLTPELIATLTSLLPKTTGSGPQASSAQQTPAVSGAPDVAAGPNAKVGHWQHNQGVDQSGHVMQQPGGHMNPQFQQFQAAAPVVPNMAGQYHQQVNSYGQTMMPQAPKSKPMAPLMPMHGGPYSAGPEFNQHYQQGNSQLGMRGQGVDNGTNAPRFQNSSVVPQPSYSVAFPNQVHVNNVSMPQPYMPQPSDVDGTQQSQPPQTAPYGGGGAQERPETEADKNERYKSTLLFAANLLSRIHQPEQGAGGNPNH